MRQPHGRIIALVLLVAVLAIPLTSYLVSFGVAPWELELPRQVHASGGPHVTRYSESQLTGTEISPKIRASLRDRAAMASKKYIDPSAPPCRDFYQHACGSWVKDFTLPTDETKWQLSFDAVRHRMTHSMRRLLEADGGTAGKLYRSCLDTKTTAKRGSMPYKQDADVRFLDAMNNTHESLVNALAILQRADSGGLFDFSIEADMNDPSHNMLYLVQGGLTMPDPTYYLDSSKRDIADRVESAIVAMMELLGGSADAAMEWAAAAMAVEKELARFTRSSSVLRTLTTRNVTSISELNTEYRGIDWSMLWERMGIDAAIVPTLMFNVADPEYFRQLSSLVLAHDAEYFKPYLRWKKLMSSSVHLDSRFQKQGMAMRAAIFGEARRPPRWRTCVEKITHSTAHLSERLYIDAKFDKRLIDVAYGMLSEMRSVFHDDIDALDWIDGSVRTAAHEKLDAMVFNIGFPSRSTPFNLTLRQGCWYENAIAIGTEEVTRSLHRLAVPVDRRSWGDSSALEINAFYDVHKNAIFVPLGILQPPFIDVQRADALNYGALGALLGHEMTHAFDDQGRRYGPYGKMHNWWDNRTAAAYALRAKCLAQYYSTMTVEGIHANGELELGENIADSGGLRLAFMALQRRHANLTVDAQPQSPGTQPSRGETVLLPLEESRLARSFFTSYAQQWCEKSNSKTDKQMMLTDAHAPGSLRVNAPLALMPAFASAFGCAAKSPMNNTAKRNCRLW